MATTSKANPGKPVSSVSAQLFDVAGTEVGKVELPVSLFKVVASAKLLAQYVRVYLSNQRQGSHKTKDRGEVSISTRKIYRQKGTGRARHGAKSAALFVGGGVTHGPVVRTHALNMSKKQRQKALTYSLSLKAENNSVVVLDNLGTLTGKTKEVSSLFAALKLDPKKTLLVYSPEQAQLCKRLMGNIKQSYASQDRLLNAFVVLKADKILFTHEALKDFLAFRKVSS